MGGWLNFEIPDAVVLVALVALLATILYMWSAADRRRFEILLSRSDKEAEKRDQANKAFSWRIDGEAAKRQAQFDQEAEKPERTIKAVIAWRLTAMTLLGRDTPELPPETLFTDIEINALEDFAQDRKLAPPDNLGRAVLTMAILGGYLNFKRKTYAAPGHKIIWEGCTRLTTTAQTYERALRLDKAGKLYQRMRSDKTYG